MQTWLFSLPDPDIHKIRKRGRPQPVFLNRLNLKRDKIKLQNLSLLENTILHTAAQLFRN